MLDDSRRAGDEKKNAFGKMFMFGGGTQFVRYPRVRSPWCSFPSIFLTTIRLSREFNTLKVIGSIPVGDIFFGPRRSFLLLYFLLFILPCNLAALLYFRRCMASTAAAAAAASAVASAAPAASALIEIDGSQGEGGGQVRLESHGHLAA